MLMVTSAYLVRDIYYYYKKNIVVEASTTALVVHHVQLSIRVMLL